MDTQQTNSEYMLLFCGNEWYNGLSPEELQTVMAQSKVWFDRLKEQGIVRAGQALGRSGATIKQGRVLADGPFAESKEAIGGFLLLRVASQEEAVAIAKSNPGLPYGGSIEVRPVIDECALDVRAREMAAARQLAIA